MRGPPIPQRIPPLQWRKPAFLWTPLALALAVGWPAALLAIEPTLQRLTLAVGAAVFALALLMLGASWALGRAPRTRRAVVLHVLIASAVAALAAPLVLAELFPLTAGAEQTGASISMAITPLALVLGLPIALISGTVFAWVALAQDGSKNKALEDGLYRPHDVQPFR